MTLRSEMDDQMRMLDIGQEAVVLSGLNKHASTSLKNIKNLYDETKYLKTYLEKVSIKNCTTLIFNYDVKMFAMACNDPHTLRLTNKI